MESGTSSATIVRTVQSLGYSGLQELKRDVAMVFTSSVALKSGSNSALTTWVPA